MPFVGIDLFIEIDLATVEFHHLLLLESVDVTEMLDQSITFYQRS